MHKQQRIRVSLFSVRTRVSVFSGRTNVPIGLSATFNPSVVEVTVTFFMFMPAPVQGMFPE